MKNKRSYIWSRASRSTGMCVVVGKFLRREENDHSSILKLHLWQQQCKGYSLCLQNSRLCALLPCSLAFKCWSKGCCVMGEVMGSQTKVATFKSSTWKTIKKNKKHFNYSMLKSIIIIIIIHWIFTCQIGWTHHDLESKRELNLTEVAEACLIYLRHIKINVLF